LTVRDPKRKSDFIAQIDSGLDRALNESTLHGIRVQTMFQLMVASFGKVRLIKQEDAGECYYCSDEPIRVPDFKVVQADGKTVLIETKNHFTTTPLNPFRIRGRDLDALARYSAFLQAPLKLAIYWARWNTWTLNDPETLKPDPGGRSAQISFVDALIKSEMASLGDVTIGTKHPLMLRLVAATDKPRSITPEGEVAINLASFQILCAGELVEDELEQNVALYLMMYGKWQDSDPGAELDLDGVPTAILHRFEPEEIHPGQGFEMIGSLSSMFSAFYNSVTLEQSRVANLAHYDDPGAFAPVIPPDYKGKALPLWRFIQQPNSEQQPEP
jgi:hypothetical protein